MAKRLTVRDFDRGYKAILKSLETLARKTPRVVVGVVGAKGAAMHTKKIGTYKLTGYVRKDWGARKKTTTHALLQASGLTVVEIGHKHEMGIGVPQRAFIAPIIDQNGRRYMSRLTAAIGQTVLAAARANAAQDMERPFKRLGLKVQGDIKRRITAGIQPPLSKRTLELKGKNKTTPLIDTGHLISSISFEVRTS